jgi:hyperosmotically inducible periplasmic protein
METLLRIPRAKKEHIIMKIKSNTRFTIIAAASMLFTTNAGLLADQTDDHIVESAKKSFVFKNFLKKDSIKTESKNGSVTLTGTVEHEYQKTLAEDTVASIPEVKSVDNRLKIKPDGSTPNADKLLVLKVEAMMLLQRNLKSSKTDVSSENGKITLRGVASSKAQKELITEYAKDVDGVAGVTNDMVVAEGKDEPGRTMAEKIDDASITAQIKLSLLTHRSTSAVKTQIQTREGLVTVSGVTSNADEKSLVTKLIMDVNGVSSVVNNMTLP